MTFETLFAVPAGQSEASSRDLLTIYLHPERGAISTQHAGAQPAKVLQRYPSVRVGDPQAAAMLRPALCVAALPLRSLAERGVFCVCQLPVAVAVEQLEQLLDCGPCAPAKVEQRAFRRCPTGRIDGLHDSRSIYVRHPARHDTWSMCEQHAIHQYKIDYGCTRDPITWIDLNAILNSPLGFNHHA
jgi:hypothetical protein